MKTGDYYSPFEDGDAMVLRFVKEDEICYYFEDQTMHRKDLPFRWFKREKPIDRVVNDQPFVFPYESYSLWSRQLAESYTVKELQAVLINLEGLSGKYAKQHLSAIEATTSMQSQSQRRAHARNNLSGNYEKKQAYRNAIELHQNYPAKCRK